MADSFDAEVNHPPIQVENTMQKMNKALQTNDKKKNFNTDAAFHG